MGVAYYIALEYELPDVDTFIDGKSLATAIDILDKIAVEIGVKPLQSFFSIEPDYAEDVIESIEIGVEDFTNFIDKHPEINAEQLKEMGIDISDIKTSLTDAKSNPELIPQEIQWFEAKEGLITIKALINHIEKSSEQINLFGNCKTNNLLQDLEDCKRILAEAEKQNIRWYLAIDM